DDVDLHRFTWNNHAIVGQRLDLDAVRQHDRLLELAFFLPQAEIDLELAGVVDRHRAQLTPQHADGEQPVLQRLHRRLVVDGVEDLLRGSGGDVNRDETFVEVFRYASARELGQALQAAVDTIEQRRFVLLHLRGQRRLD